jgi:hypothetical protein
MECERTCPLGLREVETADASVQAMLLGKGDKNA